MTVDRYIDTVLFRRSLGAYTRDAFYRTPWRQTSLEVDFGVWWTHEHSWPKYRVSLVVNTGELVAVRQGLDVFYVLAELADPPVASDDLAAFAAHVRTLADELLAGWDGDEPGNRLEWVLDRIAQGATA